LVNAKFISRALNFANLRISQILRIFISTIKNRENFEYKKKKESHKLCLLLCSVHKTSNSLIMAEYLKFAEEICAELFFADFTQIRKNKFRKMDIQKISSAKFSTCHP